jgi:hypothetical protein
VSVVQRFAEREPLTQALAYAATLQDRGWGCLFVGASFLIVRRREDGVFARLQRPRAIDLRILGEIRTRTATTRLLVEPALAGDLVEADGTRRSWHFDPDAPDSTAPFEALGWRPSPRGIAHGKTLVVDLALPIDDVVASFSTAARRNARRAEAIASVTYGARRFDEATARDRDEIHALYRTFLGERPHLPDEWAFRERLVEHFRRRGWFVTAHDASGLLGVVYLLVHDRVAHYHAAFSRPQARAVRAPSGLVLAAMRLAQAQGCDLFDFVGIRDERAPARNPKWVGFTDFKLRFGGVPIFFPPAYEATP